MLVAHPQGSFPQRIVQWLTLYCVDFSLHAQRFIMTLAYTHLSCWAPLQALIRKCTMHVCRYICMHVFGYLYLVVYWVGGRVQCAAPRRWWYRQWYRLQIIDWFKPLIASAVTDLPQLHILHTNTDKSIGVSQTTAAVSVLNSAAKSEMKSYSAPTYNKTNVQTCAYIIYVWLHKLLPKV